MRRDDDILRINPNNAQNDLLARISSIETNARNYNQVIDVVNNKSPDAEHDEDSVDNSVVKLSPSPPENGPAILMPSGVGVNGRPDWETVEFSRCTNKVSRGVKSGLQKRNKYLQPIDLVIPYAGSEASSAKGDYGIEDSQAQGFFAEQAALAVKIQNAVGEVANTTANPKPKRPFSVAVVSTLSDDDHSKQTSNKLLSGTDSGKALRYAKKGRKSRNGPLRPTIVDELGRPILYTFGEGITIAPFRTGKIGGGKSLTAYANHSPRDAIDRQKSQWRPIHDIQQFSANPIMLPPLMSIGGTSFDAFMAWEEDNLGFVPKGSFQYVTTTPQDMLPDDIAAAASRKKIQSVAGLTCVDLGDMINSVPVVMLDYTDGANKQFVSLEAMRLALENYCNMQPELMVDRSDVIVKLNEFSNSLGKNSEGAKIWVENSNSGTKGIDLQHRDLFIAHSINLNRHRVDSLARGVTDSTSIENEMTYAVKRAFAQAYGRNAGEILLSDLELHRAKIKMAQIVIYLPEDMEIIGRETLVTRLQNSINQALKRKLGSKYELPTFVTTYAVPMEQHEHPVISLRLMTHAKDLFDLIREDTPEIYQFMISNHSVNELKNGKKPKTKIVENSNWHSEISAMKDKQNRSIPFFSRWADVLSILVKRMYSSSWSKRRKDAWDNKKEGF